MALRFKAEKGFDAQHFRQGWQGYVMTAHAHDRSLQRPCAAQLAHSGFDAIQRSKN